MSLNSMDPFDMDMREEMAQMEAMMNAMMGGRIGGRSPFTHSVRAPMQGMGFSRSNSTPTVSLDKDRNYIVQLQIPGLDKSEIKAEVNGNILTVSGVQREEQSSSGKGGQSYVSSFSSFQNSFSLPGPAKSEGVKMDYKGDMLTIKIPKA
jgi:HSP20 family molecular chaperone IbpA